jgi:hypothetical protein
VKKVTIYSSLFPYLISLRAAVIGVELVGKNSLLKIAGFSDFECVENLYGNSLDNLSFKINRCNGVAFKVIRGRK